MKEISAIVILFNPIIKNITSLVEKLLLSVDHVILVDNSAKDNLDLFRPILNDNTVYLYNGNLHGIAGGHNMGIKYAKEKFFSNYVVLFDQDSFIEKSMIDQLFSDYKKLLSSGLKIGAIGPTPINRETGLAYRPRVIKQKSIIGFDDIFEEIQIISSGKLTSMGVLSDVGYMEEFLFIDGVDSEWCWRARSKGYHIVMSQRATMSHMLGEGDKSLLGMRIAITSSKRLYFQYRNYLVLLMRGYVPVYWKLNNAVKYLIKIFVYGFLISPRLRNLKNIFIGLKDGVVSIFLGKK